MPPRTLPRPEPRIGCSGWNYESWRGAFYPRDLSRADWLGFYAARFDTVEVNNTFDRLPERSTFETWRRTVPANFALALKASRFLTHMKRLHDPDEPLKRLFSRAEALGRQLGPVLYQLPERLTIDLPRLEAFVRALPSTSKARRIQHVLEFRHPSWYVSETFGLLEQQGVALCLHDKLGSAIRALFDSV